MNDLHPDADAFQRARRDVVRAVAVLMPPAMRENTLAARNFLYHAEEFMTWMDAFYFGRDPDADPDDG